MTLDVHFDLPDDVRAALGREPAEWAEELRLAAAATMYRTRRLSLEQAAALAGRSRLDFADALRRFQVSLFNWDDEELRGELEAAAG